MEDFVDVLAWHVWLAVTDKPAFARVDPVALRRTTEAVRRVLAERGEAAGVDGLERELLAAASRAVGPVGEVAGDRWRQLGRIRDAIWFTLGRRQAASEPEFVLR